MMVENARREASLLAGWGGIIQGVSKKLQQNPHKPFLPTYAEAVASIPGGFSTVMAV